MRTMTHWLTSLLVLPVLAMVSCASGRRMPSGLIDGKLSACPKSPNCVSSEEPGNPSFVEPFPCKGTSAESWTLLKRVVLDMGGGIQKESGQYLWATFRSKVFRFVDDVEFRLDEEESEAVEAGHSESWYDS